MDLKSHAVALGRAKAAVGNLRADDIGTKRQVVAIYDYLGKLEADVTQAVNEEALREPEADAPEAAPAGENPT